MNTCFGDFLTSSSALDKLSECFPEDFDFCLMISKIPFDASIGQSQVICKQWENVYQYLIPQ